MQLKMKLSSKLELVTIRVSNDAQNVEQFKHRHLSIGHSGKLVISSYECPRGKLIRSVPAFLYGVDYANARHIVGDKYDLRKESFAKSKAQR